MMELVSLREDILLSLLLGNGVNRAGPDGELARRLVVNGVRFAISLRWAVRSLAVGWPPAASGREEKKGRRKAAVQPRIPAGAATPPQRRLPGAGRLAGCHGQRQRDPEGGAAARLGVDRDGPGVG